MKISKEEVAKRNVALATMLGYIYFPFKEEERGLSFGWIKGDRRMVEIDRRISKAPKHKLLARTTKDIRFLNDWNLLMGEVVPFIHSIDDEDYYLGVSGDTYGVYPVDRGDLIYRPYFEADCETNLISCWTCLSDFALWYNNLL